MSEATGKEQLRVVSCSIIQVTISLTISSMVGGKGGNGGTVLQRQTAIQKGAFNYGAVLRLSSVVYHVFERLASRRLLCSLCFSALKAAAARI